MTTPLEKKSAEIAALVAALSVRIRRNSNERCFEYRCSEHHEWQHLWRNILGNTVPDEVLP